jgi:hypothetical protein
VEAVARLDDADIVMRVVEAGKPGFQLCSGETDLFVFDKRMISAEEVLRELRPESTTVEQTVAQIKAKG